MRLFHGTVFHTDHLTPYNLTTFNLWREVSKRCMDIERQNMEASMKEKK
jgi:hypothetical protein